MKAFDDAELCTAEFVRQQEIDEWKIIDHSSSNLHAVRSCGRIEKFANRSDATDFVDARGIECLIKHLFS